jgi:hypothetical protein
MLLASQISISGQQDPWPPTPAFLSLLEGVQPSTLACVTVSFYEIVDQISHCEGLSYHAIDELEIPRALRVAVSGSVLRTGLVARVFRHATIGIHSHKVQSTVQTARKVRHINIEGELVVQQVEMLIRLVILHKVQTRANIGTGDEAELKLGSRGSDTVSARVIGTI